MKDFYRIIATKVNEKPYYQLEYTENGEIYLGYASYDFNKLLKWKEENLDVKEMVVNENGGTNYEQGLTDAWEAARKMHKSVQDGGMTPNALIEIFGTPYTSEIILKNTAAEVIAKLKAYEKEQQKIEQEIKVGDEVVENDDISKRIIKRGVITYIKPTGRGNLYNVLWDDGRSCGYYEKEIKKTDRHLSEVEKLLKAMKKK